MAGMGKIVIAFDLYGTLLSTESIAKELATHFGEEKAASLAGLWRRYQLEYTWRLNAISTPASIDNNSSVSDLPLTASSRTISALLRHYPQFAQSCFG